uniref:Tyrosine-protein phosphatase domain-containing protein n=1 Tax=Cyprinus carpio TaxID=7962 RepID=A0A8C1S4S6_CYPCA
MTLRAYFIYLELFVVPRYNLFPLYGETKNAAFLVYDKTRVPVGENEGYINASYIRMKVGTEQLFYISAQGPLPGTQDNFWQMVWENKSDVIAMMTREVERGRVKCHNQVRSMYLMEIFLL